jgi:hypothetical protein
LNLKDIKIAVAGAFREFARSEFRPSHLVIGGIVVLGAAINLIFARGWTIWPFVAAFGILTYINEAADRNGQGIPPFQVYAFLIGTVGVWIVLVFFLSSINPLILVLGLLAVGYRGTQAFLNKRERDRLIAYRRTEGLCLHCGAVNNPGAPFCESCGEEPNPDDALLRRVAEIYRTPQDMARARATLSRATAGAGSSASAKEKALLARHRTGKQSPRSELPKAAKLGPKRK